ncbi:hypothetical protein WAX88_09190 [Photobacterium damselae subsp. damselae]|uniref:hypothetical protein n=1 Tax=Photobacterium damselae TaxID=38293 RepID=UPI00311AFCB4
MGRDVHKFYDFCIPIFEKTKKSICFIKTLSAVNRSNNRFFNYILLFIDIFYIPIFSYFNYRKDYFFIREFNTVTFVFSALIMFPLRKRVILNVNHNFQKATTSKLKLYSLKIIDFLGYRYFCFEAGFSPIAFDLPVLSVPFLIPQNSIKLRSKDFGKLKVGFVGAYRKEKKIEDILIELDTVYSDVDVIPILGTNSVELLHDYEKRGWTTYNTSNCKMYEKAMNEIDILILNYNQDDYYYRHSGVLTDAIANQKFVIIPDYPYFKTQISTPCSVGLTYKTLKEINILILEAKEIIRNNKINYSKYCKMRSEENIVKAFDNILE